MQLRQPNNAQLALAAEERLGRPVSVHAARNVRALLLGQPVGHGRPGPLGVAYTALSHPHGPTAAVLLALDDLGFWLTHPPDHRHHDPERHWMGRVGRLLESGDRGRTTALLAALRDALTADPWGQLPLDLGPLAL